MDYRKFLGRQRERVLPWFGGPRVGGADGRWELTESPPAPGWYRFRVVGRKATPLDPVEPDALETLPAVRGHCLDPRRVVVEGAWVEHLRLPPEHEPEPFAPVLARRWPSGELLLERLEFEDDAEEQVREASESGAGLAGVKGIPATLRAAYGLHLAEGAAERLELPASPLELRAQLAAIADGGRDRAEAEVRALDARRQEALRRRASPQVSAPPPAPTQSWRPATQEDRFEARAERALQQAGAELVRSRRVGDDQREVVYRFLGQRFVSIVDERGLQVQDAGICLSGADRELTLESLPGVIREAVDTGVLYVTRRAHAD